jgi:glycosyltransferase involved in cell wall biosynthesis
VEEVPELVRDVRPRQDLVALHKLRRIIRAGRYHIVHTHTAKGGILGRIAAKAAGAPVIVHTLHGSTFHGAVGRIPHAVYWSLEKLTAAFTDRIISVGDDLRRRYLEAGIGRADQYGVILSGMELDEFEAASRMSPDRRADIRASLGVPADAPLVGKVARLEARKGYTYYFDMAERVLARIPKAYFLGIGAGEQHEELRAEAARRGLAARVGFPGFRSDIAEVIGALDVVVLTSLWEGLPRVLVQAAACGVPTATFEVEGAREVVKEGVNGHVVPARDVEALADRVSSLLADPARARAMGLAGQALVHDGWSVTSMVRQIEAVYDSLCERRNGNSPCGS